MDSMPTFLDLSRLLTSLPLPVNAPPRSLTAIMANSYFHQLHEQFAGDFAALLDLYAASASTPDPLKSITTHVSFTGNVVSVAKQVVNVWLLSQFRVEAPGVTGDKAPAFDAGFFEQGAIWPAIGAHPIGYSSKLNGYWSREP